MKLIARLLIGVFILYAQQAVAATGCNYPTTLDSYSDKVTGDYLTTADINSRSCAIEQLEIRVSQLAAGRAGGQVITGGTGASETLQLRSTASGTKGIVLFGTASSYSELNDRIGIGTTNPTHKLNVISTGDGVARFQMTNPGSAGPFIELFHDTSSPAVSDAVGAIRVFGRTSTAATPMTHQIAFNLDDPTNSSLDTSIQFAVANNVNAGRAATIATLNSLGQWQNASAAINKDYEGGLEGALEKLKELKTLGIFRAKNIPADKIANTSRHYGPTAEEFFTVFRLGKQDSGTISTTDPAWIAAKAVLELEARVQALEKVAP